MFLLLVILLAIEMTKAKLSKDNVHYFYSTKDLNDTRNNTVKIKNMKKLVPAIQLLHVKNCKHAADNTDEQTAK